ncbi:MAG: hypothetical protein IKT08_01070 [Bacteroidales bacterium]|nr:hypothetical protein [Bacteroidales bacterium]
MKKVFTTLLVVLVCAIFPISAWCQKQSTSQAVENALKNGGYKIYIVRDSYRYADYFNPYQECWLEVPSCDIDKDDFDNYFRRNPQFQADRVRTRSELKFRKNHTYVTSFSFHNNHKVLSTLEFAIRLENRNQNLRLPSFQDLNEANTFYQQYVKRFSKIAGDYKEEFKSSFSQTLSDNPEALKRFCDGSPYLNNELVKELDVWQLLARAEKKYNFVYYSTANNGYYFDMANKLSYNGELRNGKPNGKGNSRGWEGTFVDGIKKGSFIYTLTQDRYEGVRRASESDDSGRYDYWDKFTFKRTGNCVDDQWDGEVRLEITCAKCPGSDVYKETYSKGQLIKKDLVSDNLTNNLNEQRIRENARLQANREQARRLAEERRLQEASVNVNTVRSFVKSITEYKDSGNWVEFEVNFTDGRMGWIEYNKSKGEWAGQDGWFFGDAKYYYPTPNSQDAALLVLYKFLH